MFERLLSRKSHRGSSSGADEQLDRPNSPSRAQRAGLAHVVGANRVVVVDTETTGLYSTDRVIEVAVVTFDPSGSVVDEWDTLINPQRDVGPTWLHGITSSMLTDAPAFGDVAGTLAARLHGAVVVAHNLPFDARLLRSEFDRLGAAFDVAAGIDTLRLVRCKLDVACHQFGIERTDAHRALSDARATGQLLFRVAEECEGPTAPARFLADVPTVQVDRRRPRMPNESFTSAPPTWLAGLAAGLRHDAADVELVGYLEVLNLAMADLHLDEIERDELAVLAEAFGLRDAHVAHAHRRWLDDLVAAATADGTVDQNEYETLCRAAAVLGVDQSILDRRTAQHRSASTRVSLAVCTVCFTGEPVDEMGRPIQRSTLEHHARTIGLTPVGSVTKSGCQLLVAADPTSLSGKAAKARQFGIPIVSACDFLRASAGDSLVGQVVVVAQVDTHVCVECQRAWTEPRSRGPRPRLCPDCRLLPSSELPENRRTEATLTLETLRCVACGSDFERVRSRGRKPTRCPSCG